jgi:hypothetical protein
MVAKIDLVKGYHQIPVAASDIPKMAIIMPLGLFEYLFMPFGLSNAAQSWARAFVITPYSQGRPPSWCCGWYDNHYATLLQAPMPKTKRRWGQPPSGAWMSLAGTEEKPKLKP